ARFFDRFFDRIKHWESVNRGAALARSTTTDEDVFTWPMLFRVRPALLRMKQTGLAGDSLTDDFSLLVDKDAHGGRYSPCFEKSAWEELNRALTTLGTVES